MTGDINGKCQRAFCNCVSAHTVYVRNTTFLPWYFIIVSLCCSPACFHLYCMHFLYFNDILCVHYTPCMCSYIIVIMVIVFLLNVFSLPTLIFVCFFVLFFSNVSIFLEHFLQFFSFGYLFFFHTSIASISSGMRFQHELWSVCTVYFIVNFKNNLQWN